MHLQYDAVQDRKKLRELVRLFILDRKGTVVSGLQMRQYVNSRYGIDIDHHEYAYTLDEMSRRGEVSFYRPHSGDTQYYVKGSED